jgi:oligoribonuclease NrnB/cAMP/cGMP phosphodiesterase (DHH superfamily)
MAKAIWGAIFATYLLGFMSCGHYVADQIEVSWEDDIERDAGHIMGKGEPFAACYWDTPGWRVFSLRSEDGAQDVSEVAAKFGGGGHKHAAGFKLPLDELHRLF